MCSTRAETEREREEHCYEYEFNFNVFIKRARSGHEKLTKRKQSEKSEMLIENYARGAKRTEDEGAHTASI